MNGKSTKKNTVIDIDGVKYHVYDTDFDFTVEQGVNGKIIRISDGQYGVCVSVEDGK